MKLLFEMELAPCKYCKERTALEKSCRPGFALRCMTCGQIVEANSDAELLAKWNAVNGLAA